MAHLHLPDGLLPAWLWLPPLVLALLLLSLAGRGTSPRRAGYQGALGALMLAAMAIPLGPLEYHLSLAGAVGVLLGPAGALQVMFIASVVLAFVGHGGFTVIGLNTLVLSAAATLSWLVFGPLAARLTPAWAMGLASGAGHAVAGVLWILAVTLAWRAPLSPPSLGGAAAHAEAATAAMVALWIVGTLAESVVAYGLGRFLGRVHPALLGAAREEAA